MAEFAWPESLPQSFLIAGSSLQRQKQAEHAAPDSGPSISIRRFTAYSEFFQGQLLMTKEQWNTAVNFYDDTLGGGVARFDWLHPITGDAREVKFNLAVERDLAIAESLGPDKFLVDIALEILP